MKATYTPALMQTFLRQLEWVMGVPDGTSAQIRAAVICSKVALMSRFQSRSKGGH